MPEGELRDRPFPAAPPTASTGNRASTAVVAREFLIDGY
jgi:hypothetical protein